jgi:hypothetical protein
MRDMDRGVYVTDEGMKPLEATPAPTAGSPPADIADDEQRMPGSPASVRYRSMSPASTRFWTSRHPHTISLCRAHPEVGDVYHCTRCCELTRAMGMTATTDGGVQVPADQVTVDERGVAWLTDQRLFHAARLRGIATRLEKAAPPFGMEEPARWVREAADYLEGGR